MEAIRGKRVSLMMRGKSHKMGCRLKDKAHLGANGLQSLRRGSYRGRYASHLRPDEEQWAPNLGGI